jgi:phage terminase small subunit
MTAKRSGAKRSAKKATKKAARKAAAVTIPSPVEVLGEVGSTLSEKQHRFCVLYAANPNARAAYQEAFGNESAGAAKTEGYKLLQLPAVKEFVSTLRAELLERYNVTNERIIEEYARIAFVDLAELYGEDGKLLPVHEMPEHARRAVAGIEVDELFEGAGKDRTQVGFTTKVKLNGKREDPEDAHRPGRARREREPGRSAGRCEAAC